LKRNPHDASFLIFHGVQERLFLGVIVDYWLHGVVGPVVLAQGGDCSLGFAGESDPRVGRSPLVA
jgi:hypothetical protein